MNDSGLLESDDRPVIVSVIVPVYNAMPYLEQCMENILSQTIQEIELIAVDDCSSDGSSKFLDDCARKDARVRVIHNAAQCGAGESRNKGMDLARGEYLLFLDADDFFAKNMVKSLWEKACRDDADIVICDLCFYDNETGEMSEADCTLKREYIMNLGTPFSYKDIRERIFQFSYPALWNKLYKRKFVQKNNLRFQSLQKYNDKYFVDSSLVLAGRISVVDSRLVTYRTNNHSSIQGMNNQTPNFDFYYALLGIEETLHKTGLFEEVEKSFAYECAGTCIDAVNKQRSFCCFGEVFDFIRETVFPHFYMNIYAERYGYAGSFGEVLKIMSLTSEEYIFNRYYNAAHPSKEQYLLPHRLIGESTKLILYGAGNVGRAYYRQIMKNKRYHLIAWADRNYKQPMEGCVQLISPEKIKDYEFDRIIIAIESMRLKEEVRNFLIDGGIPPEKLIFR